MSEIEMERRPTEDIETGNAGTEQVPIEERKRMKRQLKLYQAALDGDWNKALKIYNKDNDEINRAITTRKETALHIAALAKQTHFVKELVKKMSNEGLTHQDIEGNTALCFAVAAGKKELAKAMLNENKDLATTRGATGLLPVHMAAYFGHKDMVTYLYHKTNKTIEDDDRKNLFVMLINADMYDIALDIIRKGKEYLAVEQDNFGETALHVLARKPHMFSHAHQRRKCFNLGSIYVESQNMMRQKARELLDLAWQQTILTEDRINDMVDKKWGPIFVAVEQGNIKFLQILIHSYPDLVLITNEKQQTIFHAAVVSRREEIFKLIHKTGTFKNMIAKIHDHDGNNMLHLAGELAPSDRLNFVPGPVFQLQRELLWFEEVKNVVGPQLAEQKNGTSQSSKTPRELFIKKHKDLIKEGEEWMKSTSNYCMIVATLIATVVFAAAYTVPGGNNQNTGFPMFLHKPTFKLFAIADAISLIFSISSVIMFLSLLTSTYALEHFLWSLPNKLVIGLACLFVSLLAMLVAFVTAFFVYFKKWQLLLGYAVPVALAACIPVVLFIWSHRRLVLQVFGSTYKSKKLFRPDHTDPLFPAVKVQ